MEKALDSHSMETTKVTRKVLLMETRMLGLEMGSSLDLALLVKMWAQLKAGSLGPCLGSWMGLHSGLPKEFLKDSLKAKLKVP